MGLLARPLGVLLKLIFDFVGSYGIAIIIFTVIAKICMFPLYIKQMKSTEKMSEMQPKIQEIQQRYATNKEMQNEKLMELYDKEGYNPAGGCFPMAIQMLIIFPLFALLRNPILYIGNSTEMLLAVHSSFLWIGDLTQPDLWILPIAAGITTFISFAGMAMPTAGAEMPSQKIMKYLFPIMIVYMGRSFPAGVTIYWFINTLLQLFINIFIKKKRVKKQLIKEKEAELKRQHKNNK